MKQCGAVVPVKLLFIYNKTYLSEGRILFQFQILSYLIHGNSLIPCKPVHIVTAWKWPLKIYVPRPQTTWMV